MKPAGAPKIIRCPDGAFDRIACHGKNILQLKIAYGKFRI